MRKIDIAEILTPYTTRSIQKILKGYIVQYGLRLLLYMDLGSTGFTANTDFLQFLYSGEYKKMILLSFKCL